MSKRAQSLLSRRGRVAALFLLFAPLCVAQMVPVSDPSGEPAVSPSTSSEPLYNGGSSSAVGGIAAGLPPAPAAVTLPPPGRPTKEATRRKKEPYHMRPLRALSFGLTASTLGAGAEIAMPLASTLNVRLGASYVRYDYLFGIDGINYDPAIKLRSGRGTIDWFPHRGGFHISAGALYFRNAIAGTAKVTEGQSFTLAGTTYTNSVDDPIHGTASITYHKTTAPLLLLGFGNILPRSGRHISVPFEFGGAYLQPPTVNLALAGTACTTDGCFNAATDPTIRANVSTEASRFTSDLRVLAVYPIVSLGLACRF